MKTIQWRYTVTQISCGKEKRSRCVITHLPIKLASLDADPVLRNSHTQILHGQHGPSLSRTALSTATETRPLDAQMGVGRAALALARFSASDACSGARRARPAGRGGYVQTRGGIKTAHRVVGAGAVGGADARVLVRVGSDVGDELLGRESKESRKVRRSLVWTVAWGREAGHGEIVRGHGIGDLSSSQVSPDLDGR